MAWTSSTWFYAGVLSKIGKFRWLAMTEMEIGLGRPAMTDMLTEDDADLLGCLVMTYRI